MQYTRDKPKLHDSERLNIKMETKEKDSNPDITGRIQANRYACIEKR